MHPLMSKALWALILMLSFCNTAMSQTVCGDVDGNGQVTSLDAAFISRHLAGSLILRPGQLRVADVNNDRRVTAQDASLIAQTTVGVVPVSSLRCPAAPPPPVNCGDVNRDGTLTSVDAAFVARHVTGTATLPPALLKFADTSGDGRVTAVDAEFISHVVVGLLPSSALRCNGL